MHLRPTPGTSIVASVVIVVWGLTTHGTFAGTGNEPHYMIATHSLAFDGDLDLANNYRDATVITEGTLQPEDHARLHHGRLRPMHDVGMPLLFAPAFRVAYPLAEGLASVLPPAWLERARLNERLLLRHQMSLLMALLAGFLARELFLLFRDMGGTVRHAWWWALLFALSPPILSHAFLFLTEIPTALLALVVFRRLSMRPVQNMAPALALGALAGLLLIVHSKNVGLVAGLSLVAVTAIRRGTLPRAAGGAFLTGVAAAAVARTAVVHALWGTFLVTPYAASGELAPLATTLHDAFIRFTGLLVDREHGLLAYAPVYLLAAAGCFVLGRGRTNLWTDVGLVLAAYLIPVLLPQTNLHGWRGGWSPAARFLVPVVPLLCLAAYAYVLVGSRRVVLTLVAMQVAVSAYVWQYPKTLWNEGDGHAAFAGAQWLPTWAAPSFIQVVLFAAALYGCVVFGHHCARAAGMSPAAAEARTPTAPT
jgi:hypothetical protein